MRSKEPGTRVVIVALAANIAIALTKFVAVLFVKPQTEETWLRRNESVGRRSAEKPG